MAEVIELKPFYPYGQNSVIFTAENATPGRYVCESYHYEETEMIKTQRDSLAGRVKKLEADYAALLERHRRLVVAANELKDMWESDSNVPVIINGIMESLLAALAEVDDGV